MCSPHLVFASALCISSFRKFWRPVQKWPKRSWQVFRSSVGMRIRPSIAWRKACSLLSNTGVELAGRYSSTLVCRDHCFWSFIFYCIIIGFVTCLPKNHMFLILSYVNCLQRSANQERVNDCQRGPSLRAQVGRASFVGGTQKQHRAHARARALFPRIGYNDRRFSTGIFVVHSTIICHFNPSTRIII